MGAEFCPHCAVTEARLAEAEAVIEQLYAQTRIARANWEVALAAVEDFRSPDPDRARLAG